MTALYAESFESIAAAADLSAKGWGSGSNRSLTAGRFDTQALRLTQSGNYAGRTFANSVTVITGFAFKMSAAPVSEGQIFKLYDGATLHVDLRVDSAGHLRVTRNGTALGTGTIVMSTATWYYIEFKVKIDDTTGTAQTKINGVTDLNLTGQDTRNGAAAQLNLFEFNCQSFSSGTTLDFDDFVLMNTAGSTNNDFIGDVRVEFLLPSGNGNSSQFVGSDANSTDNYLLVDDDGPGPDGDTTYVESSTVNDKDTYVMQDLTPGTGTVFWVQPVPYARKTDAGTRSIATVARLSATETLSADNALSSTYAWYPDIRETKPGGGAWSISDVNNTEFGVEVTA